MTDTVLVTGAGGFIGSHLVEALLAQGRNVRALVRYNGRGERGRLEEVCARRPAGLTVLFGDVTDPYFVDGAVAGCASVFHLAALVAIPYSYAAARNVFDVNVMGTMHVAQACVHHGATMLHTSTSEVYGTAQRVPIDEGHPLVGQSPYAASKIGADQCVLSFVRSFGLRAATLRPFNTYGPRQSARAIVPSLLTQALTQDKVRVGALHPTRDLTYVTDTVAGFLLAEKHMDAALGGTFNLGTGSEISIGALADKVLALVDRGCVLEADPVRLRPAASEVERLLSDPRLAQRVLGYAPAVSLEQGLALTLEYVRSHGSLYRPGEYLL